MKYIKTYEQIETEPKIGDYVLCEEDSVFTNSEIVNKLIKDKIGTIIDIDFGKDNPYKIHFDDIEEVKDFIGFKLFENNSRYFKISEIIISSPDIKVIESYINSNKYNI